MASFFEQLWMVLLELAPWLLLGAAVAGLLHGMLPAGFVHRQLRGSWGVVKAVALGVPLPLCSCGVIPAGLGLKKDGAADGAAVGFLISTPQTGVDSLLVSASFLGWPFALFKLGSATVTGLVGGFWVDRIGDRAATDEAATGMEETGSRDPRKMAQHTLEVLRTIWRWLVFGVVVSAAISVFVPEAWLASIGELGAVGAALAALVVSLPLYVCATASVPIAAALVAGGMPAGAALVFLMAGPATNVATVGAVHRALGGRVLGVYLTTIIVGSVGLGIAFDFVLGGGPTAMVHTHHTPWWAAASAILLLGTMATFAAQDARAWLRRRKIPDDHRVELAVTGMKCNGCRGKVERALQAVDGVTTATVTLDPGQAVVTGTITEGSIRAVIEGLGYQTSQC